MVLRPRRRIDEHGVLGRQPVVELQISDRVRPGWDLGDTAVVNVGAQGAENLAAKRL
jgi:hypothetical protein